VRLKEIYQHSGGYNEQHKNRRNATATVWVYFILFKNLSSLLYAFRAGEVLMIF